MLYIYRSRPSDSARDLAESMQVNCRRLKDPSSAHFGAGVRAGDTVVCWGEELAPIPNVRILNGATVIDKMAQALALKAARVPTVEVATARPPAVATVDPLLVEWQRLMREVPHPLDRPAILRVEEMIRQTRGQPLIQAEVWLPRRYNHIGGNDLLHPPALAEYWSKKENLVREYRIHVFNGKSIRAGQKQQVPDDGRPIHPWVRSLDGGWRIVYDGFSSSKPMRKVAIDAVAALGLQFGAVDLGEKADGGLIVLEVNRAPGIENNTISAYATAIEEYVHEAEA